MTIPYVGRCLGSAGPPLEESRQVDDGRETGICPACSGRFELHDGRLVAHETAPDDERESA